MIVQCEICGTKYNVEDSKITPEGVKVRCSKCQHIFAVTSSSSPPPPASPPAEGEDFLQDLESFEKFHKELMDTPGPETTGEESLIERGGMSETAFEDMGATPPSEGPSMADFPTEEWPGPPLEERRPAESMEEEMETPTFDMRWLEEEEEEYFERPRVAPRKRRVSRIFLLLIILLVVAAGGFYFLRQRGMELSLPVNIPDVPSLFESIPGKLQSIWDDIRGMERGSLSFSDLEGYKDTIGHVPVFVITGKIVNDTNKTKKHVRIRATLLNAKNKVLDEKQTLCGIYFTKEALRKLSPRFTERNFSIRPRPSEMRAAPGMSIPFVVIFPNMPPDANEFQVEILEAPSA